jgi:predicted P-loop ATPase/GTPase
MSETKKTGLLAGYERKKNGWSPLVPGAYKAQFIDQIQDNIHALLVDDLASATMVRRDKRTLEYLLRIGIGKKNRYVPNQYHRQYGVRVFACKDDVIEALKELLDEARRGIYDETLDEVLVLEHDTA